MTWRHLMILAASVFALAATICAVSAIAAPPVTVVLSPEQVNVSVTTQGDNVTIDDGTTAVVVTTHADEIMTVTTAGEQGIPGPSGPAGPGVPPGGTPGQVLGKSGFADYSTAWVDPPAGGGVSSWNDLTDKPAEFPPSAHTQGIDTVTGLQTALDGKATLGGDVNFGNITMPDNTAIFIGGSGGLAGTTIDNGQIDVGSVYATWIGNTFSDRIAAGSLKTMLNHLFTTGNVHSLEASQIPGLATVATSGSYNDLTDQPVLLRGFDGREIELQTSATHIQWRYLGASTWTDLVPLASLTGADGADGKNYTCAITGGIRSLQYDKDGLNPAPTMVAFGVELRENGAVVTPATYSWSVPTTGSLLSGSSSAPTFTPTVASTFTASSDNRVDVAVTYAGVTCSATAPVPATKVGADGQAGSPDTKQQIYTKISSATTGDVLGTEAGAGDAATFAFRTVRATGGDIHRTDLAGGQTFIHARPSDNSTTVKFGLKTSDGTIKTHFRADGCLVIQ